MRAFNTISSRVERLKIQNKLMKLKAKLEKKYLKHPGVLGIGVALKNTDGKFTDDICIRFYVKKKKKEKSIPLNEVIPKEIKGWKTDVMVIPKGKFSEDTIRYRPLVGGARIQNAEFDVKHEPGKDPVIKSSNGTLGCIAVDNSTDKHGFITNAHVVNYGGAAVNDPIGQPNAPCDPCCCVCGHVGKIAKIEYDGSSVDSAFVELKDGVSGSNQIKEIGVITGIAQALMGDKVRKYGATTQLTSGLVVAINGAISPDGTSDTFTNQIEVAQVGSDPFSLQGDSGSVYVNERNEVIGLHFADGDNGHSYGNHIDAVLTALDVTILSASPDDGVEPFGGASISVQENSTLHTLSQWESELYEINYHSDEWLQIRNEINHLIQSNKQVATVWKRYQGPSFLGHLGKRLENKNYQVPTTIQSRHWSNLLLKMSMILKEHGSTHLVQFVEEQASTIIQLPPDPQAIKEFVFEYTRSMTTPVIA